MKPTDKPILDSMGGIGDADGGGYGSLQLE